MPTLDEVKKMQQQGFSESEIIKALREQGKSYKEISEALSQSKIRAAIEAPPVNFNNNQDFPQEPEIPVPSPYENTLPDQTAETDLKDLPPLSQSEEYSDEQYGKFQEQYPESDTYNQDYQSEQPYNQRYEYQSPISTDTITEIAEQVMSEKLSDLRKALDKVLDFRTVTESKIESVDERLKRIEKIIDTLQSSVLKKVGDYITNVNDIKKELIETQKSFSKAIPGLGKRKFKSESARTKRKTKKK